MLVAFFSANLITSNPSLTFMHSWHLNTFTSPGAEIVSTVISRIAEGSSVKERSSSVLVVLSTLSVSAGDAASIEGTNLWDVSFYYTPNANGEEDLTIGKGTFAPSPTGRLDAGENLALTDLRNTIDLSNLVCPAVSSPECYQVENKVML